MNKKSATALLSGCVLVGGFVGLASAQDDSGSYGSQSAVEVVEEAVEETVDTSVASTADVVTIQDTDEEDTGNTDGTEADADAETDAVEGEREGCERGEHNGRKGRGGRSLHGLAEAIGVESDALREAIASGQTIAEVAEANGVDVDTLMETLTASFQERLDAKVEAGQITAEEAAEKLAERTERLEDKINGVDTSDQEAA